MKYLIMGLLALTVVVGHHMTRDRKEGLRSAEHEQVKGANDLEEPK